MVCTTCSDTVRAAAPLVMFAAAIALVGGVAAYNYKYNYEAISTYFETRKEMLFMKMNQGTMVVSDTV